MIFDIPLIKVWSMSPTLTLAQIFLIIWNSRAWWEWHYVTIIVRSLKCHEFHFTVLEHLLWQPSHPAVKNSKQLREAMLENNWDLSPANIFEVSSHSQHQHDSHVKPYCTIPVQVSQLMLYAGRTKDPCLSCSNCSLKPVHFEVVCYMTIDNRFLESFKAMVLNWGQFCSPKTIFRYFWLWQLWSGVPGI